MNGFKGTDKNGQCRGYQYEKNNDYEYEKAELCSSGGHFCTAPLDVLSYYPPGSGSRYFEVNAEDEDVSEETRNDDSKRVTKKLHIGAEIGIAGLIKAHFEFVKANVQESIEKGDSEAATAGDSGAATAGYKGAATAGDYGAATAGDSGAATAGNYGAATAGYKGAATAGNYGAATAGYKGAATAGYKGAATAGNYGAATSRGRSAVGDNGAALARGNDVMVKGGIGSILVLVEEKTDNYDISEWKAFLVDGKTYKPNVWYTLKNGEITEVEDEDAEE